MNNTTYELKDRENKDTIINQLKSQIFELEQNAKDYNTLQAKCKQLANEASILNEEKIRLEYELKQKTQNSNKLISELQTEKESLQNTLNEKLVTNKTLFTDNNSLFQNLEEKNQEVEHLKEALDERDEIISQLQDEKHNLEMFLNDLQQSKKSDELNIQKINNELDHYTKLCKEQENTIKNLNAEKKNLVDEIGTLTFDNKNLAQKIKSTAENLNFSSKQLNDANKTILRLDEELNQTEKELAKTKNELNSINNMLTSEKRAKNEMEEKANQLDSTLKEKMDAIKDLNNEIISLNSNIEILNKDKDRTNNEIDKYKAHIMFLTETNQKLINELDTIIERDQQLKMLLSQGDDIPKFLNETRNDIDNALNTLEMGLTIQK